MPVKLFRGDTWRRRWLLKDKATGVAIDLTGSTARLHVRDTTGAKIAEATTGADARLVITPLSGQIDMVMPYSATLLTPGRHKFDLEVTHADGTRTTYESDFLTVVEDASYD